MEYKYTVAVRCMTYNHAHYIGDALRGFSMQETDFPVVNIIVDDASTDGEQDVIKKWVAENLDVTSGELWREMPYGLLMEAPLRRNRNSTFVILLLSENHYQTGRGKMRLDYIAEWNDKAKYHSLCEGDDYWIHPMKLQRQVEFMESNPDYSMCFTNALVSYDHLDKPAYVFNQIGEDGEIRLSEMLDRWICPTPGILYRALIMPRYPVNGKIISGDWHLTLHCAACGKVWGMKAVMAVYRKTESASSLSNTYAHRADEAFLRKVPILEGLDEYTNGKYHELISQYIRYYSKMGQLISFKKKHGMLATVLLKPLTLLEMVWKRNIRPRFDKNAPTYSA